jgi:hypothetical protein
VLPMVRVDRLYLGPVSAPDKLGSDQIKPYGLNWVAINLNLY